MINRGDQLITVREAYENNLIIKWDLYYKAIGPNDNGSNSFKHLKIVAITKATNSFGDRYDIHTDGADSKVKPRRLGPTEFIVARTKSSVIWIEVES